MPITTEDLVSSLLSIGYEKVDSALFISAKNVIAKVFKLEDYSINKFFNSPITFNGTFFKLREGLSLNSSISMILNRNKDLTNYLISTGFGTVSDKPKARTLVMNSSN